MIDVGSYAIKHAEDIRKAQKYTFRFLVRVGKSYKLYGNGVLVEIDSRHFILSAAHVLEERDDLWIPVGDNLIIPGGKIKYSNFIETREKDSVDIGIMELDSSTVSELKSYYSFLPKDNILFPHVTNEKLLYTFLGYPKSFSKYSPIMESFHSRLFFHNNLPAPEQVYLKLNRNSNENIIIKYDRQSSLNIRKEMLTNGPDLYGMSGCGLWFTNPSDSYKISEPKLIAIMTDWPTRDRSVVVGTKMSLFARAFNTEFGIAV